MGSSSKRLRQIAVMGLLLAAVASPAYAARRLVILVPGLSRSAESWKPLQERLQRDVPDLSPPGATWRFFDHWLSATSTRSVSVAARDLAGRIEAYWNQDGPYDEIILVGHSVGGLLIRQAYLLGSGADTPDGAPEEWVAHVSRILLFASINRGVHPEERFYGRVVAAVLRRVPHPRLVIEDLLEGSDFVTNLRINWIRHFAGLRLKGTAPRVVQLLGARDDIVRIDDSRDLLVFRGDRPIWIPEAGHEDLYRLDVRGIDVDLRLAQIKRAFTETAMPRSVSPDPITRVVFVLHGIRATSNDAWIDALTQTVKRLGGAGTEVVHPEYGWLTAAQFAIPSLRRRGIAVFKDMYTEELARHPLAQFSIIAHSNGTYMLGESLLGVPAMQFDHVVLAGSVLPRGFPWERMQSQRQVLRVRNDMSRWDWPVGLLCRGLNALFMGDVGTGGFNGFDYRTAMDVAAYYDGGHGGAFEKSENLERIAHFALGDPFQKGSDLVAGPDWRFAAFSRGMPYLVWLSIGLAAFSVYIFVWKGPAGRRRLRMSGIVLAVLVLYIVLDVV